MSDLNQLVEEHIKITDPTSDLDNLKLQEQEVRERVSGAPAQGEADVSDTAPDVEQPQRPTAAHPEGNPFNPSHAVGCKCPSCNKKAKAARGEPAAEATPHPKHTPKEPVDTVARAKTAAEARWLKHQQEQYDWEGTPLEVAQDHLAKLRKEIELGGRILQQRHNEATQQFVQCYICKRDIVNGKWAMNRTIRDPNTGLLQNIFLCSQSCIASATSQTSQQPPANKLGPTGLPKPATPQFVKEAEGK